MLNWWRKFKEFLNRDNWYAAAGAVILLYVVTSVTLRYYFIDTSDLQKILHSLPLIAALMVVIGYFDKKRKEEADRIKKKKRYEARLEISRLQRESGAATKGQARKPERAGPDKTRD